MKIKLGDIFYANLDPVVGSEQDGIRPVIIMQNNVGNKYSPTVVIIPITSKIVKHSLPTHVLLKETKGLSKLSIALVEQIRTLDKKRLMNKITTISEKDLNEIKKAIKKNLNIRSLDIF